ncbi:hypothetical protein GH842_30350 [Bacillus thuringiensis]|nr:hypothetical protein [Bacillus thuringiensis]MRB96362.1 hypothetical protein [Bacillus thuringiensis]
MEFHEIYFRTTTFSTENKFMMETEVAVKTGVSFLAEGSFTLKTENNFNNN